MDVDGDDLIFDFNFFGLLFDLFDVVNNVWVVFKGKFIIYVIFILDWSIIVNKM